MRTIAGLLAALLLGAAVVAVPVPDTAAGRILSAWLTAFNSGDRNALLQFTKTYSPERVKHVDDDMNFREMTGGFDLRKIESSSPTNIAALVQERASDQFARLKLEVTAKAPYRIKQFGLLAIERPPEFALETGRCASSPAASGSTAITALSCSAQSWRRSAAKAITITCSSTCTRRPA